MQDLNLDSNLDSHYFTTDTATAAYLYMLGFRLIDVQVKYRSSTFVFQSTEDIQEKVRDFETTKAIGSLSIYIQCYRKCLRMAKVGKQ